MPLLGGLYRRVLGWSRHRHAPTYLAGLSFAESSFFPIPPDVMLAPMALARPERAWRFALITTIASVIGGLAGYVIGYYALEWVTPWLQQLGYYDGYLRVRGWFETWGFLAIFIAGFSPVPYKLFTITAGAVAMSLPLFAVASLVGRGARFYLVVGLIRAGGAELEDRILHHIDRLAIIVVVLGAIAYWLFKM